MKVNATVYASRGPSGLGALGCIFPRSGDLPVQRILDFTSWVGRSKGGPAKLREVDLKLFDASFQENPIPTCRLPMPTLDRVLLSLVVFAGIWIAVRIWMLLTPAEN